MRQQLVIYVISTIKRRLLRYLIIYVKCPPLTLNSPATDAMYKPIKL